MIYDPILTNKLKKEKFFSLGRKKNSIHTNRLSKESSIDNAREQKTASAYMNSRQKRSSSTISNRTPTIACQDIDSLQGLENMDKKLPKAAKHLVIKDNNLESFTDLNNSKNIKYENQASLTTEENQDKTKLPLTINKNENSMNHFGRQPIAQLQIQQLSDKRESKTNLPSIQDSKSKEKLLIVKPEHLNKNSKTAKKES